MKRNQLVRLGDFKTPFLTTSHKKNGKVRCYIYEDRSIWPSLVQLKGKRKLVTRLEQISRPQISKIASYLAAKGRIIGKRSVGLFKSYKPRWEHIAIAFLLGLLFARPAGAVIHDAPGAVAPAPKIALVKPVEVLSAPIPKKVHSVALKPVAPPQPVYVAPVGVTNCGSDPNMAFIYQHESGCRTNATNPSSGAYGLCQALPGYKMATIGADWATSWATQNAWCVQYANDRYGSTYAAYLFWVAHSWW